MKPTPIPELDVVPKSYAPHLIVIACLWAAAMTADYSDQRVAAAEERAVAAERANDRLLDCINGRDALGYVERPKTEPNDYGRTYTVCRTEEIKA